jgi:hypothetical protein
MRVVTAFDRCLFPQKFYTYTVTNKRQAGFTTCILTTYGYKLLVVINPLVVLATEYQQVVRIGSEVTDMSQRSA